MMEFIMKKKQLVPMTILIIVGIAFLSPFYAFGQQERTIEELFLQSMELQMVGEQAFSLDRDTKLAALQTLEERLADGAYSEGDPEVHLILDYLSMEGIGTQFREGGRLVNDFPDVRREAAKLLGKLGGRNAKDSLINVLLSDNEPMVMAEAAYALGSMGINENNQVTQALSYAILNQDILTPDNNFAFATLLAFEKIAAANNGIYDPAVFRALVRISQGNYIRTVKLKANEVIRTLNTY